MNYNDCNVIRTHSHLNYKRTLHRLGSNLLGSNPVLVTKTSDIAPVSSKEFLDIQGTTECRFILKRICDMIGTHYILRKTKDLLKCVLCKQIFELA